MFYATTQTMQKLDDVAIKSGLEILQMMELAGWHMLTLFSQLMINNNSNVSIVCGKGNKGGDGLSTARHLVNHGYNVQVILVDNELNKNSQHQLNLLTHTNVSIINLPDTYDLTKSNVIIDALIGYNINRPPKDHYKRAIDSINQTNTQVISYDIPTGIDPSTGKIFDPSIKATTTLMLALPKFFLKTNAAPTAGEVYLADIGIPEGMYDKVKVGSRIKFPPSGLLHLS